MKKILLLCATAFIVFAADAQTTKKKRSSKKPTKEAIAKAKFEKQQNEKVLARAAYIDSLRMDDSLRIAFDSIADLQKDSMRLAYTDSGLKYIDSSNKAYYAQRGQLRSAWDKSKKMNADITAAANISGYQATQVQYINQEYNAKAAAVLSTEDNQLKQSQLANLNTERRAKLQALLGKSKERKLEKERQAYVKKNGTDTESEWLITAGAVASN